MYNIIPLILILGSLTVIIIIVARKFSALASIDVENIPKEKEAKVKEQILSGRLKRNIVRWSSKLLRVSRPALTVLSNFFKNIYNKLYELKDNYKSEEVLEDGDLKNKIEALLTEVGELVKQNSLDEAEKKLIEIINLDNKNIDAFKTLGEIYFERQNFEEARQALEHVLKLEEGDNEEIYFILSLIYSEEGDFVKSLDSIKKALELEPNNPRYLDTMVDISIINKDKVSALDAYQKLKEVNPENQKLDELKAQIDNL